MRTDRLDGTRLDYWCARALADDDATLRFVAVAPSVVVTVTSGALRKLDQRFAPSASWADAGDVLARADALSVARRDDGRVECTARFAGVRAVGCADGPDLRVALARAFVRARFGDAVDIPPEKPHQVRGGKIEPYDAGEPIPQHGDASATGNAGDIRSVPRM